MAIVDVVGKVFSSRFIQGVEQVTPLMGLAQNRSDEVTRNGDGLVIGVMGNQVSVANYDHTGSDAVTYGKLNPGSVTFTLDKEKYIAFELEDVDRAQVAFDMFSEAIRESTRDFAAQVSTDFRSVMSAASVPSGQTETVSFTASNPTKAQRQALVLSIYDVAAALKTKGFEQMPWMLVPPPVHKELIKYLIVDRQGTALNTQTDSAFRDANLSAMFGIDIIPDWGGASALNGADCYAGITGRSLVYAQQVSRPERMRNPDRFADRYRALNTYGVAVQDLPTLYKLDVGAS